MNNFSQDPIVLITGASTGLGLRIAQLLIKKNYRLVLTARSESLHRFAAAGIFETDRINLRPLDIMNSDQRKTLIDSLAAEKKEVSILVNNAGFAFRSVLEHVEQPELLQQMITNFWGPMELTRLILPSMRKNRFGKIINVSSVGGMMAMPTMSVYSASKFALEGASESLYYEVKPWNVNVTLIEPGFINSGSFQNVKYTTLSGASMRTPDEAYYGHYRFMGAFIEKVMRRAPSNADHVANKIARVIAQKNPPLRVPATYDAYFFDYLRRFLPRSFYHWMLYRGLPYPDCWGDADRLAMRCETEREKFQIST